MPWSVELLLTPNQNNGTAQLLSWKGGLRVAEGGKPGNFPEPHCGMAWGRCLVLINADPCMLLFCR